MYHSQVKHVRGLKKKKKTDFSVRLFLEEEINSMECYAKKGLVINFAVAVYKWCYHV